MAGTRSFTKRPSTSTSNVPPGRWVQQGTGDAAYHAFLPNPLPPDPPLLIDGPMQQRLEAASLELGRLDGIGRLLPGPDTLLYSYVRKEAVLSSQIEGTQSSMTDLLLHENNAVPGVPIDDVREVSNYVGALTHGLQLLATQLPLSLRLIREVHRVLVEGARGSQQTPGEFRRSQNWIGGSGPSNAYFVPPPAHEVMPALDHLEKFIHDQNHPSLIKAGLVHAQFETIHPFLDGNGRVGRMLITLVLISERVLSSPWLYMSLHFKRNRSQYYDRLQRVRTHGEWAQWMTFYLEGVAQVARQATRTIQALLRLFEEDRLAVRSSRSGSIYQRVAAQSNMDIYEHIRQRLVVTIPDTARACGTTKPTVARALADLEQLGIVKEITGKQRNRVYAYQKYIDILNEDIIAPGETV
ncbi:MAG: Fic family protein [Byssovorax sp.]